MAIDIRGAHRGEVGRRQLFDLPLGGEDMYHASIPLLEHDSADVRRVRRTDGETPSPATDEGSIVSRHTRQQHRARALFHSVDA